MPENKIERETRPWVIFGEHKDGTVNISDGVNHQLFQNLVREIAYSICHARKIFLSRVRNLQIGKGGVVVSDGDYT